MVTDWKKEIQRDLLALGSPLFYALVVARSLIGPFYTFFYQLIVAAVFLAGLSFIIKNSNSYVAQGLVLAMLTSLFYKDIFFAIFASLIYLGLVASALCLGIGKTEIRKGLLIGFLSVAAGYYLSPFIPIP